MEWVEDLCIDDAFHVQWCQRAQDQFLPKLHSMLSQTVSHYKWVRKKTCCIRWTVIHTLFLVWKETNTSGRTNLLVNPLLADCVALRSILIVFFGLDIFSKDGICRVQQRVWPKSKWNVFWTTPCIDQRWPSFLFLLAIWVLVVDFENGWGICPFSKLFWTDDILILDRSPSFYMLQVLVCF